MCAWVYAVFFRTDAQYILISTAKGSETILVISWSFIYTDSYIYIFVIILLLLNKHHPSWILGGKYIHIYI